MKCFLIIVIYLFSNLCIACTCSETPPMKKALDEANVVVTGKVISKEFFTKKDGLLSDYIATNVKYKILVTTVHKGNIEKNILTIITGPAMGGDCGYSFQTALTYSIYLNYYPVIIKGKEVNRFLQTSICTRTGKYNKSEFDKIKKYCQLKGYS